MARKETDSDWLNTKNREGVLFKDVVIEYPFCYKTKSEKNYFRYLEDGRFEHVCLEQNKVCLLFGSRANTINTLQADDGLYFKTLANLNTVITSEEFDIYRDMCFVEYKKYLSAEKYLAGQVQNLLNNEANKKENKVLPENKMLSETNDIIINDDPEEAF